jgi:hypothetical protein
MGQSPKVSWDSWDPVGFPWDASCLSHESHGSLALCLMGRLTALGLACARELYCHYLRGDGLPYGRHSAL